MRWRWQRRLEHFLEDKLFRLTELLYERLETLLEMGRQVQGRNANHSTLKRLPNFNLYIDVR